MDTDGQAKSTWIDESCDKVVGGKDAINCPGIFFTNITRCKDKSSKFPNAILS